LFASQLAMLVLDVGLKLLANPLNQFFHFLVSAHVCFNYCIVADPVNKSRLIFQNNKKNRKRNHDHNRYHYVHCCTEPHAHLPFYLQYRPSHPPAVSRIG
jgi:hypothetical protein